ncbi:MAG: GWxTD domain-containing protein [Ignavibacteria bacterium]
MKILLFIFLLPIIFLANISIADNIYFNFDYAMFRGEDNNSIIEIFYSVNQTSLKHEKSETGFEGAAMINISILDVSTNEFVISNTYKTPSLLADTSSKSSAQKLVGQVNYVLKAGKYKLKIIGSDFNDESKQDVFEVDINVEPDKINTISMSDIELATDIKKSNNNQSIFYKNTLEVIPNPSSLYGMNLKEMFYYVEIYGLIIENISDNYKIDYTILNLNNDVLISQFKDAKRNASDRVDYGKINIDSLSSGTYIFRITVSDTTRVVSVSTEKKFYIFNNSGNKVKSGDDDYFRSEFAGKAEKELDDEFDKMNYLLTVKQIDIYESFKTIDEKRKFIYLFWKSKEYATGIPYAKIKLDYFRRVNEADDKFKESYGAGWKTDRGRIYIIYGKPDEIELHPFQASTKSYQVWKYYAVEGGGDCIFIELQPGTDVYWLVSSSFRTELRNDRWEEQLVIQ